MSIESRKITNTFDLRDESPIKIAWANDNRTLNYVTTNGMKAFLWELMANIQRRRA